VVSPAFLDFHGSATELSVSVDNDGDEPLVWSADPDASWISVPLSAGTVSPHSSASVAVRVSRSGLTAGTYQSALQFTSNGGSATVTIDMTVSGSPPDTTSPPKIGLTPTSLNFGLTATVLPVVIQNTGGKPLDWQAEPADGFVSVSPSSGQVEPGDAESVAIAVSRSGLLGGLHESSILFTSNGGSKLLPLSLMVEEDDPGPGFCDLGSPPGGGSPIKAKVLACGAAPNATSATADISAAAGTLVLVWVGSATEVEQTNPHRSGWGHDVGSRGIQCPERRD
jgi:hypothetical protein